MHARALTAKKKFSCLMTRLAAQRGAQVFFLGARCGAAHRLRPHAKNINLTKPAPVAVNSDFINSIAAREKQSAALIKLPHRFSENPLRALRSCGAYAHHITIK